MVKECQIWKKQEDIELATKEKARKRLDSLINFKGSRYITDFLRLFDIKNKSKMNSSMFVDKTVLS